MTYTSCPTDVVQAPVEVVWKLLTVPADWGEFYDIRILGVEPKGPAAVGQRFWGESGPRALHLRIAFTYVELDAARHRIVLDGQLPFGLRVREDLDCAVLSPQSCRVSYHCNFALPRGLRGRLLRLLLGRELDDGPVESLQRLKRAAEGRAADRAS